MSKFLYKYDINKYIDKVYKDVLDLYPWATIDMIKDKYEYAIEKEGNHYEFVSYFKNQDGEKSRSVLDFLKTTDDFYELVKNRCEDTLIWNTLIVDTFKMPIESGTSLHGWYLERYEFNKLSTGGYSSFVQAGDRTTGGSRTFLIPQHYFDGTYYEFIDKYVCLVPPNHFGMSREIFEDNKDLAKFLGFSDKKEE